MDGILQLGAAHAELVAISGDAMGLGETKPRWFFSSSKPTWHLKSVHLVRMILPYMAYENLYSQGIANSHVWLPEGASVVLKTSISVKSMVFLEKWSTSMGISSTYSPWMNVNCIGRHPTSQAPRYLRCVAAPAAPLIAGVFSAAIATALQPDQKPGFRWGKIEANPREVSMAQNPRCFDALLLCSIMFHWNNQRTMEFITFYPRLYVHPVLPNFSKWHIRPPLPQVVGRHAAIGAPCSPRRRGIQVLSPKGGHAMAPRSIPRGRPWQRSAR